MAVYGNLNFNSRRTSPGGGVQEVISVVYDSIMTESTLYSASYICEGQSQTILCEAGIGILDKIIDFIKGVIEKIKGFFRKLFGKVKEATEEAEKEGTPDSKQNTNSGNASGSSNSSNYNPNQIEMKKEKPKPINIQDIKDGATLDKEFIVPKPLSEGVNTLFHDLNHMVLDYNKIIEDAQFMEELCSKNDMLTDSMMDSNTKQALEQLEKCKEESKEKYLNKDKYKDLLFEDRTTSTLSSSIKSLVLENHKNGGRKITDTFNKICDEAVKGTTECQKNLEMIKSNIEQGKPTGEEDIDNAVANGELKLNSADMRALNASVKISQEICTAVTQFSSMCTSLGLEYATLICQIYKSMKRYVDKYNAGNLNESAYFDSMDAYIASI